MKSNKGFRTPVGDHGSGEGQRKAVKLPPIKKSGKDRHALYNSLDQDDEDPPMDYRKRESVLDYFDDGDQWDESGDEDRL